MQKISSSDFYDFVPPNRHRTGDIWRNLPSFGHLGKCVTSGIVITPSCDLANRKCETVTYLPIVSIKTYCSSPAFYYDTWLATAEAISKLKLTGAVISPNRFEPPLLEELSAAITTTNQAVLTDEHKRQLQRLVASHKYFSYVSSGKEVALSLLEQVFTAKSFEAVLKRVVSNAFKPDVHFLPADSKPIDMAAVPSHSVVLFRYPMTIPIEILDWAQSASSSSWPTICTTRKLQCPVIEFASEWPIRLATIKNDFLSDLLSRYVSTYIRMGSRDFTETTAEELVNDLRSS